MAPELGRCKLQGQAVKGTPGVGFDGALALRPVGTVLVLTGAREWRKQ